MQLQVLPIIEFSEVKYSFDLFFDYRQRFCNFHYKDCLIKTNNFFAKMAMEQHLKEQPLLYLYDNLILIQTDK